MLRVNFGLPISLMALLVFLLISSSEVVATVDPSKTTAHRASLPNVHTELGRDVIPAKLSKKATPVTGCTCSGLLWGAADIDNFAELIVLYSTQEYGPPNENPYGWCWQDGVQTEFFQNQIITAIEQNISTLYVNVTWAYQDCALGGITNAAKCAAFIINQNTVVTLGTSLTDTEYITSCTYPTANFVPTDCYCSFNCTNGHVACGTSYCIDPSTQSCSSGAPVPKSRRRHLSCPVGQDVCALEGGGRWECLDTMTDIESCGGCPGAIGSTDCTTISGVSSVSCVSGSCEVHACEAGYRFVDGECLLDVGIDFQRFRAQK